MEKTAIINALAALAHETRLDIFRHLVEVGPEGEPAGIIGGHFGLPAATLSFHLSQMRQAGLVASRREGRSIIYAADFASMNALIGYLTENCCGGQAADCITPVCDIELETERA